MRRVHLHRRPLASARAASGRLRTAQGRDMVGARLGRRGHHQRAIMKRALPERRAPRRATPGPCGGTNRQRAAASLAADQPLARGRSPRSGARQRGKPPGAVAAGLGAAALAGCGGSVVSQAAAPSDRDVPRVSVPEGQATQLPGTETISAEAELLGLKAGTLEWVSSGACPAKGRPLGTARASLHTAGVIRWFKRSDGAASTILDPKSSFPIEQEMRVNDSGEQRRYQLKFSPGQFHYVYERD